MTKEQNEAFEKRTELLMRVTLEVYNTLAKYHRNLETIYASAIQNNGVSETSFDSIEYCFTEAMECIPELRKRVRSSGTHSIASVKQDSTLSKDVSETPLF